MSKKYAFFWAGPFSQWFKSTFTINNMTFCTAEQYMMYKKAMHFGDTEIAEKIMNTRDPKKQKALGRQVQNFDADEWSSVAREYVYEGNLAKFTQNSELMTALLQTGDALLVEASPYDKIWGIGLGAIEAAKTPEDQWPGTNWLGQVLTQLREDVISGKVALQ